MARIRPFRGIRYNTTRFADELARLVAPPYDVIDSDEQDELYARHPQNIVRIDLNRSQDTDHPENDRYTRARRHLMDWIATGALQIDHEAALYVHYQDFDDGHGGRATRRGFICLTELAEYEEEIVLPHERTLKGPKIDRLDLMKATECNLSQVFMLYDDPDNLVDEALAQAMPEQPEIDITTPDGIRHRLWPVTDEATIQTATDFLDDRPLLIADGHHRYETSLAYRSFRREVAEESTEDAPYEYLMTFLVNTHDPGLLVFPTHRVVHGVDALDVPATIARIADAAWFEVTPLPELDARDGEALIARCEEAGAEHPSFVLVSDALDAPQLVSFLGDVSSPIFDEETPDQVRALDVAILHEGILDRMLGIDKEAQEAKTNLKYMKKLPEAMSTLDDEATQLLVLMNATPVSQVQSVCLSGGKMPQKSTYFYPKILSGLLINPV